LPYQQFAFMTVFLVRIDEPLSAMKTAGGI
jgi:hypothetical protein